MRKREVVIYETVSAAERQRLDRRRWRRDHVRDLPDGFTLVPGGRAASIYFRRQNFFTEFAAELSGDSRFDIVIFEPTPARWIEIDAFEESPVDPDEGASIRSALVDWLGQRGFRSSLEPPGS